MFTNKGNRIRYTLWAPIYDSLAPMFEGRRRRAIQLLDPQPGERVLFVGAGTGLDLRWLPAGLIITAIDLTPAMLERLRRRAEGLRVAVTARILDAQALDYPDASFDVVLLHFILTCLPDPGRCLQQVIRVLRSGGRVSVLDKFVPDDGKPSLLLRLVNPIMRNTWGTELTRQFGPLVAGTGLTVLRDEAVGWNGMYRAILLKKE